jgi:(p)ppGpp synthase/HD superfamily hydrolase
MPVPEGDDRAGDQLSLAIRIASEAHHGQVYPSPEAEPYILHPLRVMLAVGTSDRCRAAAVLHDVVEDTEVTLDDLAALGFDDEVVHAVDCLTHRSDDSYEDYIGRVATDAMATRVKLCDLADNMANNHRLEQTAQVRERLARYQAAEARLRQAGS